MDAEKLITWYSAITEGVNLGQLNQKMIVSDEKLKHAVETYGIHKASKAGDVVTDYLCLMSFSQIEFVMSYKPRFFVNGMFHKVFASTGKDIYILQKILENDVEFKCVTSKVFFGHSISDNLMCFVDTYYSHMPNLMMDVRLQSDPAVREYILLTNHIKKWISLFDMMKPILEESDKRRRF